MKGGERCQHIKQKAPQVIKICPCQTPKSYSFLTPALDGSVNFTTWSLYPPQRTPVPIEQEGRVQAYLDFWRGESLANTGIRTADLPVRFQVRVTRTSGHPKKG
jgi:hypothetical protein